MRGNELKRVARGRDAARAGGVARVPTGNRRAAPDVLAAPRALGHGLAKRAGRSGSGVGVDIRLGVTDAGRSAGFAAGPRLMISLSVLQLSPVSCLENLLSGFVLVALPSQTLGRAVTWGRRPLGASRRCITLWPDPEGWPPRLAVGLKFARLNSVKSNTYSRIVCHAL